MNTELTFYTDGTFHCDGLGATRRVRIGGGPRPPGELGCESCERFTKCGMSHTATVETKIKDFAAIKEACKLLGLEEPTIGVGNLYSSKHTGICVKLKDWRFPVVIDQKTGQLHYDNYNGSWGNEAELNRFKQYYGVAKAKLIAKKKGYFVKQFTLPNGTVRLQVTGM